MIEQYSRQAGFLLEEGARRSRSTARSRSSASRWARSAWATWPATTSAGRSASAATSRSPSLRYSQDRRPAVRDGPLRPEDRRRLVRLRAGQARRDPDPGGRRDDRRSTARSWASRRARSATRRSSSACVYALVNEGAQILEEGIALRASDIDMVYLTGYGFPLLPRRPDVLRRHRRPVQRACARCGASPRTRATTPRSGSRRRCWRSSPREGKTFN